MGQRLVLTVKKNNKPIFNIYYHWSAYTQSALEEARNIIKVLKGCNTDDSKAVVRAVALHLLGTNNKDMVRFINELYKDDPERQVASCHGGIVGDDFDEFLKDNPDLNTDAFRELNEERDRDEGLLAFTENGMKSNETWSEGDLVIDLDSHTIENDVISVFESADDFNRMAEDLGMEKCNERAIPVAPEHLDSFGIGELDAVCDFVSECWHLAKSKEGEIYEFIE